MKLIETLLHGGSKEPITKTTETTNIPLQPLSTNTTSNSLAASSQISPTGVGVSGGGGSGVGGGTNSNSSEKPDTVVKTRFKFVIFLQEYSY